MANSGEKSSVNPTLTSHWNAKQLALLTLDAQGIKDDTSTKAPMATYTSTHTRRNNRTGTIK